MLSSFTARQSTYFVFWRFLSLCFCKMYIFRSQNILWRIYFTYWRRFLSISFLPLLGVAEVLLHLLAFPLHLHLRGLQVSQSHRGLTSSVDVFSPPPFTYSSTSTAWWRSYFTYLSLLLQGFKFHSKPRSYFTQRFSSAAAVVRPSLYNSSLLLFSQRLKISDPCSFLSLTRPSSLTLRRRSFFTYWRFFSSAFIRSSRFKDVLLHLLTFSPLLLQVSQPGRRLTSANDPSFPSGFKRLSNFNLIDVLLYPPPLPALGFLIPLLSQGLHISGPHIIYLCFHSFCFHKAFKWSYFTYWHFFHKAFTFHSQQGVSLTDGSFLSASTGLGGFAASQMHYFTYWLFLSLCFHQAFKCHSSAEVLRYLLTFSFL